MVAAIMAVRFFTDRRLVSVLVGAAVHGISVMYAKYQKVQAENAPLDTEIFRKARQYKKDLTAHNDALKESALRERQILAMERILGISNEKKFL